MCSPTYTFCKMDPTTNLPTCVTDCGAGLQINTKTNTCDANKCATNQYWSKANRACVACIGGCTCTEIVACLSCDTSHGFVLSPNSNLVTCTCKPGFFMNYTVCIPCPTSCNSCSASYAQANAVSNLTCSRLNFSLLNSAGQL